MFSSPNFLRHHQDTTLHPRVFGVAIRWGISNCVFAQFGCWAFDLRIERKTGLAKKVRIFFSEFSLKCFVEKFRNAIFGKKFVGFLFGLNLEESHAIILEHYGNWPAVSVTWPQLGWCWLRPNLVVGGRFLSATFLPTRKTWLFPSNNQWSLKYPHGSKQCLFASMVSLSDSALVHCLGCYIIVHDDTLPQFHLKVGSSFLPWSIFFCKQMVSRSFLGWSTKFIYTLWPEYLVNRI